MKANLSLATTILSICSIGYCFEYGHGGFGFASILLAVLFLALFVANYTNDWDRKEEELRQLKTEVRLLSVLMAQKKQECCTPKCLCIPAKKKH